MSELLDKQSDCIEREFEEKLLGSRKLLQAHKNMCNENETKKVKTKKKRRTCRNIFDRKKHFISAYENW